jgi:hypothetical protein
MWEPEIDEAAIVMIGSFNPAIFQPHWLGSLELIRPEEAETAKIRIIQQDLADFTTDWFQLQVLQNRFLLRSSDPTHYAPLRDLAAAIFTLLPHTPIKALGLNRMLHFKMPSIEAWHGIGHVLAPKDPWNEIFESPGLRAMIMQGGREELPGGILNVKIEPSAQVQPGLYVEVNAEFKATQDQPEGAYWVTACLGKQWDAMMKVAVHAAQHLLGYVKR